MKSSKAFAILISGLPGSGKTFFAKRFAPAIGAAYFSSDVMRKTLTPERTYTHAEKSSVYHELLERFDHTIRAAQTVVMDATFYKSALRDEFEKVALAANARVFWIEVQAAEAEIKQRLLAKREDSDADFQIYQKVLAEYEPILKEHLVLRSDQMTVEEMISTANSWMEAHS